MTTTPDVIALHDGRILTVHPAELCAGPHCCIHRPSQHPLDHAPLDWWPGVGMMRHCEHGIAHPDPDDLSAKLAIFGIRGLLMVEAIEGTHFREGTCDGCCRPTEVTC